MKRCFLVVEGASVKLQAWFPFFVCEVDEELYEAEFLEAQIIHVFYGLYVSCDWGYVEEFYSCFAGFVDCCLDELFAYASASVGFADY